MELKRVQPARASASPTATKRAQTRRRLRPRRIERENRIAQSASRRGVREKMKYREQSRWAQTVRELILMPFGLVSGLLFAVEADSNREIFGPRTSAHTKTGLR